MRKCVSLWQQKKEERKENKEKNHITSETAQYINRIHILPNISRSEGNRIMKFSQYRI